MKKVVVRLPDDLIDRVRAMSEASGETFNAVLIELLALGIFDLDECEQYEDASYH